MKDDYAAQFLVSTSTAVAIAIFNLAINGQINWLWVIIAFVVPFVVLQLYQRSGFSPFKKWRVKDNELIAQAGQPTGNGSWEIDTSQTISWAIYGPYKPLGRGKYRAIFRLKINSISGDDAVVEIDVAARRGGKRLSMRTLTIQDFQQADVYQDFPLCFFLVHDDNDIEFRISSLGAKRRLILDYVALSRMI